MRPFHVLMLALFIATSGCHSTPRSEIGATEAIEPARVEVHLRHTSSTVWRLSYRFSRPTRKLVFSRGPNIFRREVFTPVEPVFRWETENDKETLTRTDGTAFETVSFDIHPYTKDLERDYEFAIRFADGSHALYTGHFEVSFESAPHPETRFLFEPLGDESLVFNGLVFNKLSNWAPDNDIHSTYVYFGRIPMKVTPTSVSLADPGLPAWLKPFVDQSLPDVFEYYEKVFAYRPRPRPFIIANVDELRTPKLAGVGGGSSPGWIQFSIRGADWRRPSRRLRQQFLFVFAHEGLHQFQGQPHNNFEKVGWLMEGGADFYSNLVLYKLNLMTARELKKSFESSLNQCLKVWNKDQIQLNNPHPDTDYGIVYGCGRTLHEAMHRLLSQKDPDGLLSLWRALLKRAGTGEVDPEWYFDELQSRLPNSETASLARSFVNQTPNDPRATILKLLDAAQIPYVIQKDRILIK